MRPNQLGELGIKAHSTIARRRIRIAPNGREDLDNLLFLHARFGDAAMAIYTDKKPRKEIDWRSRGGEANPAERTAGAVAASLCEARVQRCIRGRAALMRATERFKPLQ